MEVTFNFPKGDSAMPLWRRLYSTVWLAFLSCVLISRLLGAHVGTPVHIILGLLLLVVTVTNARSLSVLAVPERLKRICKVTAGFAVFQALDGLAMGATMHLSLNLPRIPSILHGVHVVCALIILAQAASVATAYDMWEEKEFHI
jgi:hypothetical protein